MTPAAVISRMCDPLLFGRELIRASYTNNRQHWECCRCKSYPTCTLHALRRGGIRWQLIGGHQQVAESTISTQTRELKQRSEARAPAVTRALDLLEILGRSAQGLTLSELSRRLRIPKSTTHYLIYTLAARGYLQKIPWTRQYSLGVRAFNFTSTGIAELQLRQFLAPMIRALAERLSTGVQVSVLKGDEGMVIERVDQRLLPAGTQPGRHFQLHCTAAGKVLTAWLSDGELERLFSNRGRSSSSLRTRSPIFPN
jgi:hypothetical protein